MTAPKTGRGKPKPSRRRRGRSRSRQPSTGSRARSGPTLDERLLEAAAPWKREIAGFSLIVLGILTALALAQVPLGTVGSWWMRAFRQAFGSGSWVVASSLVFGGAHVALASVGRPWRITSRQVIGFEIAFVASLALYHLMSAADREAALAMAAAGQGGGFVGWGLSVPLAEGLGTLLASVILVALGLLGAGLFFRMSQRDVQDHVLRLSARLQGWADALQHDEQAGESSLKGDAPAPAPRPPASARHRPERPPAPPSLERPPARPGADHELVIARPPSAAGPTTDRPSHLPPLDLLDPGRPLEQSDEEIREKAAVIENTLLDFGVPVRVMEVRRGPVVTQFGVAPLYVEKPGSKGQAKEKKVRVNQITALSDDLALALAASSIRMEAPVPGRPIVGIEVPNRALVTVQLRPVLQSRQFNKLESALAIGLGSDISGAPVAADLATMPHLLIAGTTGAGKSVCVNAVATCLVCSNTPEDLRLVMIDPKMVELVRFDGLPHLLGQVEVDLDRIIGVLHWMTREMDERYKVLADVGARNLSDYNRLAARRKGLRKIPCIVLLLDELADLMMLAPDEVERDLVRLAQMARAVGMHLVVATQRPSTDVVTGLIKANFPARIAFAVASSTDSRVILDRAGAESLLGRGDMLFQAPDAPAPVRLQGCIVSDAEIQRVVDFWRQQAAGAGEAEDVAAPWDDLLSRQAVVKEKDGLLEQAIALAQQNASISTSFIQRRLRIGYPRAARLMDALHELGVVGEEKAGGRMRDVLVSSDDDPLGDYVENEVDEG